MKVKKKVLKNPATRVGAKKSTLSDAVVEMMLNAIKEGKFKMGAKLPSERVLAEEFGVSRTTLRESFKKLEQLGAISIKHGSGTYIKKYDIETGIEDKNMKKVEEVIRSTFTLENYQVTQYLDARTMLEVTAIELAIDRMDDSNIVRLREILEKQESLEGLNEEYADLDCAFHREIVKASKNEFLYQFWLILEPCLREQQQRLAKTPGLFKGSKVKHRQIYEAILMRDKGKAKRAMKSHLSLILGRFFTKATEQFQITAMEEMEKARENEDNEDVDS